MADGHSKIVFVRALREAGADVRDVFNVFDYGTFDAGRILGASGLTVHALATWQDVLSVARERGEFADQALDEIDEFLAAPAAWSQAHGGQSVVASTEGVLS